MISVICPYFNDGDIIFDSVSKLINVPNVEIIIVDDGSYVPLNPAVAVTDNVRIITHKRNMGVGLAFDTGVRAAKGDIILMMGCDVFQPADWKCHVERLAAEHPQGIVAAACVSVMPQNNYIIETEPRCGAELRLKQPAQARDEWYKERNYNDVLLGAWLDPPMKEFGKCGCLMGASYVVNKSWYNHIHGFRGHKKWGGLEPLISIKSWLAGGYVAADPSWVVGHVFHRDSLTRRPGLHQYYYYNKFFIMDTCLPEMARDLDAFLGNALNIGEGRRLRKDNRAKIIRERNYNKSIFTRSFEEVLSLLKPSDAKKASVQTNV